MLNFEEKALEYIRRRGAEITIFFPELRGCCVPENLLAPEVILGRPVDKRRYEEQVIEGIKINSVPGILDHQELEVRLSGFGPFKNLTLHGWKVFQSQEMTEIKL